MLEQRVRAEAHFPSLQGAPGTGRHVGCCPASKCFPARRVQLTVFPGDSVFPTATRAPGTALATSPLRRPSRLGLFPPGRQRVCGGGQAGGSVRSGFGSNSNLTLGKCLPLSEALPASVYFQIAQAEAEKAFAAAAAETMAAEDASEAK